MRSSICSRHYFLFVKTKSLVKCLHHLVAGQNPAPEKKRQTHDVKKHPCLALYICFFYIPQVGSVFFQKMIHKLGLNPRRDSLRGKAFQILTPWRLFAYESNNGMHRLPWRPAEAWHGESAKMQGSFWTHKERIVNPWSVWLLSEKIEKTWKYSAWNGEDISSQSSRHFPLQHTVPNMVEPNIWPVGGKKYWRVNA